MQQFVFPAFGETDYSETRENNTARVFVLHNAEVASFDAYCHMLKQMNYIPREHYMREGHSFAAYEKDGEGLFLNYFHAVRELYIVAEENCRYFSYTDTSQAETVSVQITQVELEDFGMCYAIRLSDGRFIVIDGGRGFDPDIERLYRCLRNGTPHSSPIIAMWILTHPHSDHFHGFMSFMERYGAEVTVEKFLLNFPEPTDTKHYPKLAHQDPRFTDTAEVIRIPLMYEYIKKTGAPVYMAHTGQKYTVGDANCEILACMDDTIHWSDNINATSLVIRMELAGQVILWATDAAFSIARLPEKHGTYLKADILQIPHHGFQSGNPDSEIQGYKLIQPQVCLLPVSAFNAYTAFSAFRKGTEYLMTQADIEELIPGTPQRTITLPYTPPSTAKREVERSYQAGHAAAGACVWYFSELSTDRPEDLTFTVLNTTHAPTTVWIDLFFKHSEQNLRHIKLSMKACQMRRICIVGDEVEGDALYFNWMSLKERGLPNSSPFTVRFRSDIPILVSHKEHAATYWT